MDRGRGRGAGPPPRKLDAPEGDWKNAFNPEMFKEKMDKDSANTDKKIAELRGQSKDDDEAGPSRRLSGPITKEFLKKAAKDGVTQEFLKKEEADLANIMKMVEDEKKNAEMKRAQEEVDGYDYPNMTMEEFEKNVIFRHSDNVTQWVQSFCDRRGWFVQVRLYYIVYFLKDPVVSKLNCFTDPRVGRITQGSPPSHLHHHHQRRGDNLPLEQEEGLKEHGVQGDGGPAGRAASEAEAAAGDGPSGAAGADQEDAGAGGESWRVAQEEQEPEHQEGPEQERGQAADRPQGGEGGQAAEEQQQGQQAEQQQEQKQGEEEEQEQDQEEPQQEEPEEQEQDEAEQEQESGG
jgi:hypothetical protein